MNKRAWWLSCCVIAISCKSEAALSPDYFANTTLPALQKDLSSLFALDLVIHDRDTLTLGSVNFDPNSFLPFDDEDLGSDEANRLKDELLTFSLPYTFELNWPALDWQSYASGRLGFTERKHAVRLFTNIDPIHDLQRQRIYSAALGLGASKIWLNHWLLNAELFGLVQHYQNDYDYRNSVTIGLRPELDGRITNYSVNAWQVNPAFAVEYQQRWTKHFLRYRSRISGQYGHTFNEDYFGHSSDIRAYSWRNSVYYQHPLGRVAKVPLTAQVMLSRVDLGGDNRSAFDTTAYYECGVELLMGTHFINNDLLHNISLGLLLNYGSALKGGSITFSYNR